MRWPDTTPQQESENDGWSKEHNPDVDGLTCSGKKRPTPRAMYSTRKLDRFSLQDHCSAVLVERLRAESELHAFTHLPEREYQLMLALRFLQESLKMALTGSSPHERPERRYLDGKGEAHLIHLACSQAPDGRQRWTLSLLARQGLAHNIATLEELCRQVQSWQKAALPLAADQAAPQANICTPFLYIRRGRRQAN